MVLRVFLWCWGFPVVLGVFLLCWGSFCGAEGLSVVLGIFAVLLGMHALKTSAHARFTQKVGFSVVELHVLQQEVPRVFLTVWGANLCIRCFVQFEGNKMCTMCLTCG